MSPLYVKNLKRHTKSSRQLRVQSLITGGSKLPSVSIFPRSISHSFLLPLADSLDVIGFSCVTKRQLPVFRQCPSTCSVLNGKPSVPHAAQVPCLIRWDNGGRRRTAGPCGPRCQTQSTWHEMQALCIILDNLRSAWGHAVHVTVLLPALIQEWHQSWTHFHSF